MIATEFGHLFRLNFTTEDSPCNSADQKSKWPSDSSTRKSSNASSRPGILSALFIPLGSRERSTSLLVPSSNGSRMRRTLLPIASDVGGIQIAQAIRTTFAAGIGMLNLPGSSLAKSRIVFEYKCSPTDMASAVSTIKNLLKTLGWIRRHVPFLLVLALGQSEQIVSPHSISYGLEE
jgi:hypothetical protein